MWTEQRRADLNPKSFRGPRGSDAWCFHWLRIGMLINAHVPDYFDDDLVSQQLQRVWNEQSGMLPFRVE